MLALSGSSRSTSYPPKVPGGGRVPRKGARPRHPADRRSQPLWKPLCWGLAVLGSPDPDTPLTEGLNYYGTRSRD